MKMELDVDDDDDELTRRLDDGDKNNVLSVIDRKSVV